MDPVVGGLGLFGFMVVEGGADQFRVLLHHVLALEVGVRDVASPVGHLVADFLPSVELLDIDQIEGV